MSLISGIRGFSVSMYGQSGVVMDWFGLNDPFTQQVPLKITNAYSGTLWFQGYLNNPRSGYYNYSGQIGSVASGATTVLVMTWDAGVSGWITGSSPITDTLTLNLTTFTSSNYTGAYSSGNFTVFNTLFNRYSGVIKVFGDIYSNDQPTPSLSVVGGAGFVSGQTMSYAVSYILSGWESDISNLASSQTGSPSGANQIAVSWSTITGATQYFLWRWSGNTDFGLYDGGGLLRPIDLLAVTTVGSFTDNNASATQSNLFRHRTWFSTNQLSNAAGDATVSLSTPQSRRLSVAPNTQFWAHGYHVGKNASGTNLLGPFYGVFHIRTSGGGTSLPPAILLQTGNGGITSGTAIADPTIMATQSLSVWYRHAVMLGSSGSISSSGQVHIQFVVSGGNANAVGVDDVFVVAQS